VVVVVARLLGIVNVVELDERVCPPVRFSSSTGFTTWASTNWTDPSAFEYTSVMSH
jgi:hypothetical protein